MSSLYCKFKILDCELNIQSFRFGINFKFRLIRISVGGNIHRPPGSQPLSISPPPTYTTTRRLFRRVASRFHPCSNLSSSLQQAKSRLLAGVVFNSSWLSVWQVFRHLTLIIKFSNHFIQLIHHFILATVISNTIIKTTNTIIYVCTIKDIEGGG